MANMSARLMIRTRGTAMLVSALVKVLYCFVEYASCSSVLAVRLGPAPLFLMWAAIETTTLYWSMPSPVDEKGQILQVWLQVRGPARSLHASSSSAPCCAAVRMQVARCYGCVRACKCGQQIPCARRMSASDGAGLQLSTVHRASHMIRSKHLPLY